MIVVYRVLSSLLTLLSIAVLIHVAISWVRPGANRFTYILDRILEPLLSPIRNLLRAHLPSALQMFDWSPAVLLLLIGLARQVLSMLLFWFI